MAVCRRQSRRGEKRGGERKAKNEIVEGEEWDSAECGVPGQLQKNKTLSITQKMRRFREHWDDVFDENAKALRVGSRAQASDADLWEILNKILSLYSSFVEAKLVYAGEDPVFVASGGGCSALEGAFMWVGGWRPTSAVALAFSVIGVDPASAILLPKKSENVAGPADLATNEQTTLARLQALLKITQCCENNITARMATLQMTGSDTFVETFRSCPTALAESTFGEIKAALLPQLVSLTGLLAEAEHLRLSTVDQLMHILSPAQGCKWVLTAFEIIFSIRKMGSDCHEYEWPKTFSNPCSNLPLGVGSSHVQIKSTSIA